MPPFVSIPDQFRRQAGWCGRLGSPLYNHLLLRCAENYEQAGSLRDLLAPYANDEASSLLPLRFMGAVHRVVLEGKAPELAKFYPSVHGSVDLDRAWMALARLAREQEDSLRALIPCPVQTNDVGRSASLLGGFGLVALYAGLPLRLIEIGASAGLNLRWDQYRYVWSNGAWGPTDSAVRLEDVFVDGAPRIPPSIQIAERSGCDLAPVDIGTGSGVLTLLSYVWADQVERIDRLKAAIQVALGVPCSIEKARAADWLHERLRKRTAGTAAVVFHSVVWPYLSEAEKQRILVLLKEAGACASRESPLAWLRMEADEGRFEVRLRIWPGFEDRLLASSHPHTPAVRWLVSDPAPPSD